MKAIKGYDKDPVVGETATSVKGPTVVATADKPLRFSLISELSMAIQNALNEAGINANITIREESRCYKVILETT